MTPGPSRDQAGEAILEWIIFARLWQTGQVISTACLTALPPASGSVSGTYPRGFSNWWPIKHSHVSIVRVIATPFW